MYAQNAPSPVGRASPGQLTAQQAVARVLASNPGLVARDAAVLAAEGGRRQAGLLPNPEVEFEIEDLAIDSEADTTEDAKATVVVEQTLELGGKRAARQRLAQCRVDIAELERRAARLEAAAEAERRFVDLLAAQTLRRLQRSRHDLARALRDTVAERVRAGKVSTLELQRAEVELSLSKTALLSVDRDVAKAQVALAALWDGDDGEADAVVAVGDLATSDPVPQLDQLYTLQDEAPELRLVALAQSAAAAALALERTGRVPDVTVAAGWTHERASDEDFGLVAVSLPLPLFDRNQGNVAGARADMEMVRLEARQARRVARAALRGHWQDLKAAAGEVDLFDTSILPTAKASFDMAAAAYRSGKADYLELLDAQQTLVEAKELLLEAQTTLRFAWIELNRSAGTAGEIYPREGE